MGDNFTAANGDIVAADEVSRNNVTEKQQVVKIAHGLDGSHDALSDSTTPFPASTADRTDVIQNGDSQLTPQFAAIDANSSGDNTVVAALTGKIRVHAMVLVMTGTLVTIRFEDGAGGDPLTGQMTPLKGNVIEFPYNPVGWFETTAATLLNMELGDAQAVAGCLVYTEVV